MHITNLQMHSQYSTDRTLIVYHYSRLCYYEAVEKDVSDHTGSVRKYRVFQEQPKNCLEMVPVLSPEIGCILWLRLLGCFEILLWVLDRLELDSLIHCALN